MVKIMKTLTLTLIVCVMTVFAAGIVSEAEAGKKKKYERTYSVQEIVDQLYKTGHYNIRVTDDRPPYFDFDVCKGGKEYELTIDHKGNIRDRDDEGRCRVKNKKRSKYRRSSKAAFDKGTQKR